jgi:3-hydroxyisobutyrate dehydrogenase
MARKDARLMMEEAELGNQKLISIPPVAAEMDKFIQQGFGSFDWTVFAKDAVT